MEELQIFFELFTERTAGLCPNCLLEELKGFVRSLNYKNCETLSQIYIESAEERCMASIMAAINVKM